MKSINKYNRLKYTLTIICAILFLVSLIFFPLFFEEGDQNRNHFLWFGALFFISGLWAAFPSKGVQELYGLAISHLFFQIILASNLFLVEEKINISEGEIVIRSLSETIFLSYFLGAVIFVIFFLSGNLVIPALKKTKEI